MAWTDEVHRSRLLNAPRAPAQRFLKSSRPVNKTGAIPLVLVSSVLYSFVWWRKQGHKLKSRSLPFSWLQRALEKLTPPAKQPPLKKQPNSSWKQQQPAALAAVAAERRLQELQREASSPGAQHSAAGSKAGKSKKKKKKGKK